MWEKFKELLKLQKDSDKKNPLHIAITFNGVRAWSAKKEKPLEEAYQKSFSTLKDLMNIQINSNLRILTIYLLPSYQTRKETIVKHITEFLRSLEKEMFIHQNQIKISIIGKWYDLDHDLVETIKTLMSETKDYDRFFLNFCVNYNGKSEIVDALKLLARKVKADKLDPDQIDVSMIKDNIYTSYFIPPDIIIKTGIKHSTYGFMLWDSTRSIVKFADKLFPDYDKEDFLRDIREF